MVKLHFCVTKVKALFNRRCSSRLTLRTNCRTAVKARAGVRLSCRLGDLRLLSPPLYFGHGGWVCGWVGWARGLVMVTENASRQPGYGAAVIPLGCPETFHHFAGSGHDLPATRPCQVNNLINTELRQHANLTPAACQMSYSAQMTQLCEDRIKMTCFFLSFLGPS